MRLNGREFLSSLNKGETKGLYLFLGDPYLQDEAIKGLKERVLGEETFFNLNTFFGDELNLPDLVNAIETLPINAKKRLVFLKRVELLSKDRMDGIVRYLNTGIPPSTSLILCGERIDRRCELYNLLLREGVVVDFWPPFPEELPSYLEDILKVDGKRLDEEGIATLIDLKRGDLMGLVNEVRKLSLYIGKRPIITKMDVLEGSGGICQYSIFDLLDAVDEKNLKKALKIVHFLLLFGEVPLRILNFLIQEFRAIYKAKLLLLEAKDKERLRESLGILSKKRFSKILSGTSSFELSELEDGFLSLLAADTELKTQDKMLHPLILELLVLKLCGGGYQFSHP